MWKEETWIKLWSIVATALIAIVIVLSIYNYNIQIKMAELGFQKTTIVGSNNTAYQKVSIPNDAGISAGTYITDSSFTGQDTAIHMEENHITDFKERKDK